MKTSLIIMILLVLSALLMTCNAQSASRYQSVGGDFGKTWLNDFNAQNPKPAENNSKSNNLWSWGSAPKGRSVINGQLMTDPYYYWKSLNLSSGWLGQVYVDNKTGYPVFAFIDPYTGYPDYFYMDPKTGKPVFVNPRSASGSISGNTANYLPPVLSGSYDNPWLGIPYISDDSDIYGNGGTSPYYGSPYGSGVNYGGMGMV